MPVPWDGPPPDLSVPPAGQRPGGTFPPATQGRGAGQAVQAGLGGAPAVGPFGTPGRPQGRLCGVIGGAGAWQSAGPSWPVPGCNGLASSGPRVGPAADDGCLRRPTHAAAEGGAAGLLLPTTALQGGAGVHQGGGQQASSAAPLRGAISSHQGGPEGVCGQHRRPPSVGHGGPAKTIPGSRPRGPGRTAEGESSTVQPASCKRGSRLRGACVADGEKIPQVICM